MDEKAALPPVSLRGFPISLAIVVVSLITVAVVAGGFIVYFYTARKVQIRDNVMTQLSAVADLKAEEIVNWRNERLADAALLGNSPVLENLLKSLPIKSDAKKMAQRLLEPIVKSKQYRSAVIFDSTASVVLSTLEEKWLHDDLNVLPYFRHVMYYGTPLLTDLHQHSGEERYPHLSLFSPVRDYESGKIRGVLLLEIDPDDFLFPVTQTWPWESSSAEVLLVRRDGDSIITLNELRHQKNTVLSFRLPLDREDRPSSRAISGFSGIMEGRDYREVPVLASIRAIPSTPWHMIAKIDRDEAYYALNHLFRQTLASIIFMILLLVGFGVLLQRHRTALLYNNLYRTEGEKYTLARSLQQSEARFRSVFDSMTEGVTINEVMFDKQGKPVDFKVLDVNPAFEKFTGIPAVQARGATASILYGADVSSLSQEFFRVAMTGHPGTIESYFPSADKYIVISITSLGENRFATVFDDITSRKKNDNEQDTTIGLFNVLNTKNNLSEFIREIILYLKTWIKCDAIGIRIKKDNDYPYYETRGFSEDFIAMESSLCGVDDHGNPVCDEKGKPLIECMCGNVICGRFNPALPFFTKRGSFWTNNMSQVRATASEADLQVKLRNHCNTAGYESIALIQLRFAGEPLGLIQVNDRTKDHFTPENIGLLERFADNIAIAIEQRRTQADLFLEKEQYLVTLRSIGDGVITTDIGGNITLMNSVAEELTGYTIAEAAGKPLNNVFNIVNEITREICENPVDKVLSTGGVVGLANHTALIRKNGTERLIADSGAPIRNGDGNILGVVLVFRDVTEKHRVEAELLKQQEKAARYLDTVEAMVVALDLAGNITMVNRKGCQLLEYTQEELIGKNWLATCLPETERPNVLVVFNKMKQGDYSAFEYFENKVITKNGTIRDIEWHNTLVRDEQGKIIAGLCAGEDITERKQAQEALALEKERLLVTLRSIGDAVVATSVDGCITLMNRAAEQLTGWTKEESYGKPLSEVLNIIDSMSREPYDDPVAKVLETGNLFNLDSDVMLVRKNGTDIKIDSCCAPIRDSSSRIIGTTIIFRDITDKLRTEEALQKNSKLEALGSLAAGIAHDFNNLLGGLFGYLDLARENAASGGDVVQYLDKAFGVFGRTKDLTSQLLTFAKGGAPVRKMTFMPPFIRDTIQFALSGTSVKPIFSIDEHLWHCDIDEYQLAQVIDNIAINARDAMPMGGKIIISAENCTPGYSIPSTLTSGKYICIRIRDDGVGIAPEHLAFIFDPFFTTKQKGSGLGLSIAISVVNRHGGTIEVSSKLGKGTVFSIYIPASEKVPTEIFEPVLPEKHFGHGHILIMDDENYICDVTSAMLSGMGYTPVTVATGEEAIAEVEKHISDDQRYVVALLDLTIPGAMGGLDAGSAIKKIDPEIRIIAMSGYSEDPVIAHPEKYGFNGSITKPYYRTILEETITTVMRQGVSALG